MFSRRRRLRAVLHDRGLAAAVEVARALVVRRDDAHLSIRGGSDSITFLPAIVLEKPSVFEKNALPEG